MRDKNFFSSLKEELANSGVKVEMVQKRFNPPLPTLADRTRCLAGIRINKDSEINAISLGDVVVHLQDMSVSRVSGLALEDIDA